MKKVDKAYADLIDAMRVDPPIILSEDYLFDLGTVVLIGSTKDVKENDLLYYKLSDHGSGRYKRFNTKDFINNSWLDYQVRSHGFVKVIIEHERQ